jgi:adenylosuccinate lyase
VTELFGFPYAYPVTGQTYSRKIDADVLGPLSSFGATVHKMATDSEPLLSSFTAGRADVSPSTCQLEGD